MLKQKRFFFIYNNMEKIRIAKIAASKISALIKELVFFPGCAICGKALLRVDEALRGLCSDCAASFEIEQGPRCSVCGKPLISENGACVSCRQNAQGYAFDKVIVLYPYSGRFKKLLAAYKFEGRKALARFFAEKLLEGAKLLQIEGEIEGECVWVPVPPRAGKIKRTGWDQIETIARVMENSAFFDGGLNGGGCDGEGGGGGDSGEKIKIERMLKRLSSKTQKALNREERRDNLKGKILCARPVSGVKQFIIFDDIFTTGSTLSVCAKALKENGAEKVFALALFYD